MTHKALEWKTFGNYVVSSHGHVALVGNGQGWLLKPTIRKKYERYSLLLDGKRKSMSAHRLNTRGRICRICHLASKRKYTRKIYKLQKEAKHAGR